jgi:hypothetical protein
MNSLRKRIWKPGRLSRRCRAWPRVWECSAGIDVKRPLRIAPIGGRAYFVASVCPASRQAVDCKMKDRPQASPLVRLNSFSDQSAGAASRLTLRYPTKPRAAKPRSIIAHVDGSGTPFPMPALVTIE